MALALSVVSLCCKQTAVTEGLFEDTRMGETPGVGQRCLPYTQILVLCPVVISHWGQWDHISVEHVFIQNTWKTNSQ